MGCQTLTMEQLRHMIMDGAKCVDLVEPSEEDLAEYEKALEDCQQYIIHSKKINDDAEGEILQKMDSVRESMRKMGSRARRFYGKKLKNLEERLKRVQMITAETNNEERKYTAALYNASKKIYSPTENIIREIQLNDIAT